MTTFKFSKLVTNQAIPEKEGIYTLKIKLLNEEENLIKDQNLKLEINVTTKGRDKILKWVKKIGIFAINKSI